METGGKLWAMVWLAVCLAARCVDGGTDDALALVKDAGSDRVAFGFLVEVDGVSYVYTAQSAIYGMSVVAVVTGDGKRLATNGGGFEVAVNSDLARVPLTEEISGLKPAALGNLCFGLEASIVGIDSTGKARRRAAVVSGIGGRTFFLEFPDGEGLDAKGKPRPGSPVLLEDGTVVGVVGAPVSRFDIGLGWTDKVSLALSSETIVARLDAETKWVSAKDAGFGKASSPLKDLPRLTWEILPLLNWWCEDPYRAVPDNVAVPREWKAWVANNNKRAGQMEKLVAKASASPSANKGLVKSLRTSMLYRAKRLVILPSSIRASLNQKCKTWFLRSRLAIAKKEWERLFDMMNCRMKSLKYSVPGKIADNATPELPETAPAEPGAPLGDPNLLKSLVAIESSGGADNGVAVVSKGSDGALYAVTAISVLSKNLYYFRVRSLYTGKKIKVEKVERSPKGDVIRFKLAADGSGDLVPIVPVADGAAEKSVVAYLADRELGVVQAYKADPSKNTPVPRNVSSGGPLFSDNGALIGVASILESDAPNGQLGLALSPFSMDAAWKPVSYQKLAKSVETMKTVALDTASLEALASVFDAFDIIEIYPLYSQKYRKFIEAHGKLLLPTQTQGTGSDNMYRFKVLCSCLSGWKSIRAWARSNLAVLRTAKRQSKYFGKWAEALEKRNKATVDMAEKKMAELTRKHPAIKDRLL